MVRLSPTFLLFFASSVSLTTAWVPVMAPSFHHQRAATALNMAIDYNDPVVAEEFANVQPLTFEEMESELAEKGIPVSQAMSEMDLKLMLVEVRLRFSGKLGDSKPKQRPATFSSKFEEAMWTKPAFEEYYNGLKAKDDHNAMNVVAEYVNNKDLALQRYGKDYKGVLRLAEEALTAPPPVKSPTIQFSGFPANMGEDACRMTLESIGTVVDFSCTQDEDFPVLRGQVTFEDIEDAKKAVAQYDGMDMGMGTALELASV